LLRSGKQKEEFSKGGEKEKGRRAQGTQQEEGEVNRKFRSILGPRNEP